MLSRCNKPLDKNYKAYGGRGIKVCKEWSDNYIEYYNWCISNGLNLENKKLLEIDRTDNDKGYYPENCQLITKVENMLKTKFINLTLEDVAFIRSPKFNISMYKNYNCSKRVVKRIMNYEIFKVI